ncbi:MAG: type IV toxin-antitoxin system AbiEi family antitoxin, partial [Bacteroidota bacterium]
EIEIGSHHYDGVLSLGATEALAEIKGHLSGTKELLNFVTAHKSSPQPLVLLLPHLDAKTRLELEERGVNYVDTAGNCNLHLPGITVVVNVRDENPVKPFYTGKAFQRKGIILLYHLLVFPSLTSASYRVMKEHTGVSTGAISGILEDLRGQGFLAERNGKQVLINIRSLVERWSYAYLEVLRPSLHRGFLRSQDGKFLEYAQLMGISDRLFLGGQYALMVLGNYLSSSHTLIYTPLRIGELNKRYRLRPVGKDQEEGDIELLAPFWNIELEFDGGDLANKALFTADILTYADSLLGHNSRVLAAAQQFLDHEIRNRFQDAGLQW